MSCHSIASCKNLSIEKPLVDWDHFSCPFYLNIPQRGVTDGKIQGGKKGKESLVTFLLIKFFFARQVRAPLPCQTFTVYFSASSVGLNGLSFKLAWVVGDSTFIQLSLQTWHFFLSSSPFPSRKNENTIMRPFLVFSFEVSSSLPLFFFSPCLFFKVFEVWPSFTFV